MPIRIRMVIGVLRKEGGESRVMTVQFTIKLT